MKHECSSRDCLFTDYRQAVREWVAAINRLVTPTDDPHLMQRIEDTRFRALTAKAHYQNHVTEHGCKDFITPSVLGPTLVRHSHLAHVS